MKIFFVAYIFFNFRRLKYFKTNKSTSYSFVFGSYLCHPLYRQLYQRWRGWRGARTPRSRWWWWPGSRSTAAPARINNRLETSGTIKSLCLWWGTLIILCHSHLCTEQLIYISLLYKWRKSVEISAVRYINQNGIVCTSRGFLNRTTGIALLNKGRRHQKSYCWW